MLETVVHFHFFVKIVIHFIFRILWWIERPKEQHLFEIESFCNIINAFTLTFDLFNGP